MLNFTKKLILKSLNKAGYELNKVTNFKKNEFEYNPRHYEKDLIIYLENYEKKSVQEKRFFNFGSGLWKHAFWTNVDNRWGAGAHYAHMNDFLDIDWDISCLEAVQIESNFAELVYCSHVVEHLDDDSTDHMFREAYRTLKPGGAFRLVTPDVEVLYRYYLNNDKRGLVYWDDEKSIEDSFLFMICAQKADFNNTHPDKIWTSIKIRETLHQHGIDYFCNEVTRDIDMDRQVHEAAHINWWNFEKLADRLRSAGFDSVKRSHYGQSEVVVMRDTNYFDYRHPSISVYVEAFK